MSVENILPIASCAVIVLLMGYLLFFLPQRKHKKENVFFNSLKIGDSVVTIGGIHGVIVNITEHQILLQAMGGTSKLLLERHSISMEETEAIYRKKPVKEVKKKQEVGVPARKGRSKAQHKKQA